MKILATADIHIGKLPTRLPAELKKNYAAANMWEHIVSCAIEEKVNIVLISGDIIDASNKFFEATGPLEKGLKKLAEHTITTYCVAGNHDYDVLPRVCRSLNSDKLHVVGANGEWEILQHSDKMQIVGHSFTDRYMKTSPLPQFPKSKIDATIPTIGLLHADLDSSNSPYCPATTSELSNTGVPVWILGHIHKPQHHQSENGMNILYPGSPQGMDPGVGECGTHGPWIIEFSGLTPTFKQVPLAPLSYENLDVDLTNNHDTSELQNTIHKALHQYITGLVPQHPNLQCVSLRLNLTGHTDLSTMAIVEALKPLENEGTHIQEVHVLVNNVNILTSPEININELAKGEHIQAQLANLIISLQAGSVPEECEQLINELALETEHIREENPFHHYPINPIESHDLAKHLLSQSKELLETLTLQGEAHV